MKYILFVLLILVGGCDLKQKILVDEVREYTILAVDPPKYVNFDIKDNERGYVYKNAGSKKHCNKWRDIKIGTVVRTRYVKYEWNGRVYTSFPDLAYQLCK